MRVWKGRDMVLSETTDFHSCQLFCAKPVFPVQAAGTAIMLATANIFGSYDCLGSSSTDLGYQARIRCVLSDTDDKCRMLAASIQHFHQ